MNSDFVKAFLREALNKSIKSGGEKFAEELAEMLTLEQLEYLHRMFAKAIKKRKEVVDSV